MPTEKEKRFVASLFTYETSLTKREKEIITLIAKEKTVHEIAEILFLSKHTIE